MNVSQELKNKQLENNLEKENLIKELANKWAQINTLNDNLKKFNQEPNNYYVGKATLNNPSVDKVTLTCDSLDWSIQLSKRLFLSTLYLKKNVTQLDAIERKVLENQENIKELEVLLNFKMQDQAVSDNSLVLEPESKIDQLDIPKVNSEKTTLSTPAVLVVSIQISPEVWEEKLNLVETLELKETYNKKVMSYNIIKNNMKAYEDLKMETYVLNAKVKNILDKYKELKEKKSLFSRLKQFLGL